MEPAPEACRYCPRYHRDVCMSEKESSTCSFNKSPKSKKDAEILKINTEDDFGFTFKEQIPASSVDWEEKFNRLKELVMPLLKNLAKNPDKDIHWPDRDKKIKEFIKKIQEI
jgi:hypothetical protein